MKTWYVDITYKRGPAFGAELKGDDKEAAIQRAKEMARECGWVAPVKHVAAREVTA